MKKLIHGAAVALALTVVTAAATADIVAPERIVPGPGSTITIPRSGIINDYYISLQDSKGACSTIIISAKSSVEALKIAQDFCTDCLVMDVTDNFNKSSALARQTERYCPIR